MRGRPHLLAGAFIAAVLAASALVSPAAALKLFGLVDTGELYSSGNGGVSWSAVSTLPVRDATSFVSTLSQTGMTALLATTSELLASTEAGEVAATADGIAWSWRGAINQLTVMALASDQPNPAAVGLPEPAALATFAPWPNPAREQVALAFELEREGVLSVTVHDLAGREVARPIANERFAAGRATHPWRPAALPSGVYFLQARFGERVQTRPLVWLGSD